MKRYLPNQPFPAYAFLPGRSFHPNSEAGHQFGANWIASPIDPQNPAENETLRFALDLLNHEYFWESHIYFEALWNAENREGRVAEFCKACIKVAAAGVKFKLGLEAPGKLHLAKARELWSLIQQSQGNSFLGFPLLNLMDQLDAISKGGEFSFKVIPHWG